MGKSDLQSSVILEAKDVGRDFKIGDGSVVSALKGINAEIEKGTLTILRGRSGSGKTTLLRCLNFLETPDSGTIVLNGNTLFDGSQKKAAKEEEIRRAVRDFVDHFGENGRVMAFIMTDMTDPMQDVIARDELYHYSLEYYNKLYGRA